MTVDIERLQQLIEQATPGPWQWVDPDTDLPCLPDAPCATGDHCRHAYRLSLRTVAEFPTQSVGPLPQFVIGSAEEFNEHEQADGSWTHPDAEFIAGAVNALPELLSAHRERDELKAQLAKATSRDTLVIAMQEAWDSFVGDTGDHPDCFWRDGRLLFANFARGNFALMAANALAREVSNADD